MGLMNKTQNCAECGFMKKYDYDKKIYYCDHEDRIDDMKINNRYYRAIKIICKTEIQEILITINRVDCVYLHNNSII